MLLTVYDKDLEGYLPYFSLTIRKKLGRNNKELIIITKIQLLLHIV